MSLVNCFIKRNFGLVDILKETKNNLVIKIKKLNKFYVAKILIYSLSIGPEKYNMITEIQALKYLTDHIKSHFFVKYIDNFLCNSDINVVIMEYLTGKLLLDYQFEKMDFAWWISLLRQLIVAIYLLEKNRILHNDFWDANIIIEPITINYSLDFHDENINFSIENRGFIIKIIDFQYMNQYTTNPNIYSPFVMTTEKKYQQEKKRLGWSSKFHLGGDLNQILGILSDYQYIPLNIRHNIKTIVKFNPKNDFPYAVQKENIKTSAIYLIKNFNKLIK